MINDEWPIVGKPAQVFRSLAAQLVDYCAVTPLTIERSRVPQTDRLPPHSIESEQCLIASMMLDREVIGDVVGVVSSREMFFQADHGILFGLLVQLYEENKPIDAVILREELLKRQLLEEIGGVPYLATLLGMLPSAANAIQYANAVREKFLLRQIITAGNEQLRDAYAPHESAEAIVDRAEQRILAISETRIVGGLVAVSEIAPDVLSSITDTTGPRGLETRFVEMAGAPEVREYRQQQVSAISGGMHTIANGLDLPVISLPQFGRSLEIRTEHRPPMIARSECVGGTTQLVDADSGALLKISDVAPGQRIVCGDDRHTKLGTVAEVRTTGLQPVSRLTTKSGRSVVATRQHRFLTDRGWVALQEISDSDLVATVFRLPTCGQQLHENEDLCRLAGYMVGNGSYQKNRTCGLILPDDQAFADACSVITRRWPEVQIKKKNNGYNDAWFSRVYENGFGKPGGNPLIEWLKAVGMHGSRDCQKRVPDFVFRSGQDGVAAFLSGYLAADGCVARCGRRWSVRFDTTSEQLAQDVAILLSRLGVACTIGPPTRTRLSVRDLYRISVSQNPENVRRLSGVVRPAGYRGRKLLAAVSQNRATRSDIFNLPISATAHAASLGRWRDQGKRLCRSSAAALA